MVNVDLIVDLVSWFVSCGGLGPALDLAARHVPSSFGADDDRSFEGGQCVLVFLPGTREIQDAQQALAASGRLRDAVWVQPLHGSLPPDEQRRVFEPAPRGLIKVVLATNVAETSITLPDVGLVIDTGRQKEERYDPTRRMASLDDTWVSAAQAKQRRGRAGRVRPGLCIHLYPSDAPLSPHPQPEVRRVALEQLVLRTKALQLQAHGSDLAADVCAELPEPPTTEAVSGAVEELVLCGALTAGAERLTPLGELLTKLPLDARLGKLIVYGLCFGAADEALTLGAVLSARSPFLSPAERREEADRSKRAFSDEPTPAQSDHIAVLRAYRTYDSLPPDRRYAFARERFLGAKTLQAVGALKRQLLEALSP